MSGSAHIKDGVAGTKFIHWLKTNVAKETITELSAAEKLYQFRSEQEHFLGDSFDPIIAYGTHAAIVHYSATKETDIPLEAKGMVLADTGGHYLEGTTDITRTIVLGRSATKKEIFYRCSAWESESGSCEIQVWMYRIKLRLSCARTTLGTGRGL